MIEQDHIHYPRSYVTYSCKTCGDELFWDGEWGEWMVENQFEDDPIWLNNLLLNRSNTFSICTSPVDYFEADFCNSLFKRKGIRLDKGTIIKE